MSKRPDGLELVVDPLFYDVLSGRFMPKCDPQRQVHTLGRLARGAFMRGTVIPVDEASKRFEYTPTWASKLTAVSLCLAVGRTGLVSLTGLELNGPNADQIEISFIDNTPTGQDSDPEQTVVLRENSKTQWLNTNMGEKLKHTQNTVAIATQHFCDRMVANS